MQDDIQTLIAEIEATAAALNIATSTVSERAGQGGKFYERIKSGKSRAWPETIASVRDRLVEMRGLSSVDELLHCDKSHGYAAPARQGKPLKNKAGAA